MYLLRFNAERGSRERAAINKIDITEVQPGDKVFIDLRRWDECWYDQLGLPNSYTLKHVVEAVYTVWDKSKNKQTNHKRIKLRVNLFDEDLMFNHYEVYCWGQVNVFIPSDMILVNEELVNLFPKILSDDPAKQRCLLERLVRE